MRLTINGIERSVDAATVADAVKLLGLEPTRIAVELNLNIVRKADYPTTALKDGDRMEVVTLVGGG